MSRTLIPVDELILDGSNSRKHAAADVAATAESLFQFGQQTPIVITPDRMVVKGNGTVLAARLLRERQEKAAAKLDRTPEDERLLAQDWSQLWHVTTELEGPELRAYSIADNKTGMLAPFDLANIGEAMRGFRDVGRLKDFSIGWTEREVGMFLGAPAKDDPADKLDRADALLEKWRVADGDLFAIHGRLGAHRLLCGDCTLADNIARLMDGKQADLLCTDPPYNVDYAGHVGSERDGIANDAHGEDFGVWLHSALTAAAMVLGKGRSWYVFYANSETRHVFAALHNADMQVRQCLVWLKNSMVMGRQDYHWQHEPCQPPGTLIWTPTGQRAIEEIKSGDEVVTWNRFSGQITGVRGGYRVKAASRNYSGQMYSVACAGRVTRATDGHKFSVRFNPVAAKNYCVYLMNRGDWWRVGVTKAYDARQFGLKSRMLKEGGDRAWILSMHASKLEAEVEETRITLEYGIPQTCWEFSDRPSRANVAYARAKRDAVYLALDLEKLGGRSRQCLADHGRSVRFPLVDDESMARKFSRRCTAEIVAANLIPGLMQLPVPLGSWQGFETFRWLDVDHVSSEWYAGPVYSLDVEKYQHYIADGLVTHNCLYGWTDGWQADPVAADPLARLGRPVTFPHPDGYTPAYQSVAYGWKVGTGHRWFSDRKQTTVLQFDRPSRSEDHPTMKPVPLIAYLLRNSSRMGEIVLDIFLGSGTTMYAAEQTQRLCYGTELSPKFCAVILERMEAAGCRIERL